MQFYKLEGTITNQNWTVENEKRSFLRERIRKLCIKSSDFNQKLQGQTCFYITDASDNILHAGIICQESSKLQEQIQTFLESLELSVIDIRTEEITLNTALSMLQTSCRRDYMEDEEEILEHFELNKLYSRFDRDLNYDEKIIDKASKTSIYKRASAFSADSSLCSELDRIYAGRSVKNAIGHPVHYVIQTDDAETRQNQYCLLLQALYANGRLSSRRCCLVHIRPELRFSSATYDCLYKSCIGGAVIVTYLAGSDIEDDRASGSRDTIEKLCRTMKKYRNQVLTIFALPLECTETKDIFYENLEDTSFVEMQEEFMFNKTAEEFLKKLAKKHGIRCEKKLFSILEKNKGYLAPELHALFDRWYDRKLKTSFYPQYSAVRTMEQSTIKAAPKGSAYTELMEMIGLTEAKKIIRQALAYSKAQKLFSEKGMAVDHLSMHMVFSGNPGTAKTTVARLFARIMRENHLLSKGYLIEAGRGDLVGKYIGWTAPMIQKKFKEAEGSVLFIDEAYSLVDDRDGSYGDEAINTIVQEMENHRDSVIVIFAGYPDKMETFLQKNPGLRSRIAFHVPFDDYSTDELCDIARLTARKKGLQLSENAFEKLEQVFSAARGQEDFGNGRYVRNVIEKAQMAQAVRLLDQDCGRITSEDIMTLRAEDIEIPEITGKQNRSIGFVFSA